MSPKNDGSWKVGQPTWSYKDEAENYRSYWPKGKYKTVKVEIDGIEWVFKVHKSTDIIHFVISPTYKNKRGRGTAETWMIGKTVSQFVQVASSPLVIESPIDQNIGTGLIASRLTSSVFNFAPSGVKYFEQLAEKIAYYMSTVYSDWLSLMPEARMYTTPYMKFAVGLIHHQAKDKSAMPHILAAYFIEKAPETLGVKQVNIDKFFKELTDKVYTYKPETSYEKIYESYHDAQQLTDEKLRGTIREAEIREMHESQAGKVVLKHEEYQVQVKERTEKIIGLLNEELADAIRTARQSDRGAAVQRMERLAATVEMIISEGGSPASLNRLIAMEPELSTKIKMYSQDLVNRTPEPGFAKPGYYALSFNDQRLQDESGRIKKEHDTRKYETDVAIRAIEAEGNTEAMNRVVTQAFPMQAPWTALPEAHNIRTEKESQDKYRGMVYDGMAPPAPGLDPRVSKQPRAGGTGPFDKTGVLRKDLRPPSKKFKMTKPQMRWGRKLYSGVLDINLTVKNFRERDKPHAINTAMLHHLLQRFGGSDKAFAKLEQAVEKGAAVTNEHAFKTMLPTFVNMVHAKTQHFQGMDELKAGRRGVFFEFIDPTPSDIKINKGKPYNIRLSMHWARVTTSRALQFYRDKEGVPRGERRQRVEEYQKLVDAHRAHPSPKGRKRAMGRGIGYMKEQRGQQFITQKYLDENKRSFLEKMDKRQHLSSERREISALFGNEAGAVVRKAVRSGERVTMALAQHLRARPGDRISVFMNDRGEIGTTVTQSISSGGPGGTQSDSRPKFRAIPTSYKKITTLTIPILTQTEPMEPVSDSFRGAMNAIKQGGYGGNIFQKLANILWNVDVPLPDWNVEQVSLTTAQIAQVTEYIRDYSKQAETVMNQDVAEERVTKKLDERIIGPAVAKIARDPELLSSTEKILQAIWKRTFKYAIDEKMVIGWTI